MHWCLQEKIEPPVYVSDRRLVKAIQLLQVAAYCNGRDAVSEYDCLLLQHVLWQKPEQADRIADWVLGQLSVDDGLKQVRVVGSRHTQATAHHGLQTHMDNIYRSNHMSSQLASQLVM